MRQPTSSPARSPMASGPIAKPNSYSADRKSTRLNSSHANISYAVFCLKKKIMSNTASSAHLQFFFFFNDTATTEIYTLSLHDALPISSHLAKLIGHQRAPHAGLLQMLELLAYAPAHVEPGQIAHGQRPHR